MIAEADAVLLDFDGPVAALFSGRPNHLVVRRLLEALEHEELSVPAHFAENRDPLKLLQWVGREHQRMTEYVDGVLTKEETLAAHTARPARGSHGVIRMLSASNVPVAIVSNNSAQAIEERVRTC